MKKSTTLLHMLEHLITEEDIQEILQARGYQDTARKLSVSMLLRFLMMAATREWKSFRHTADVAAAHGLPSVHYSALSKKASQVPYAIFKDLFTRILSRCNRRIRRSTKFPKELLLIDSTTVTVGESRLPWAPYHGKRSGIKLHVALLEASQMPYEVRETTGLHHDSPMMEDFLNPQFILVADRAYFQIKRIDTFVKTETKQPFVIRLKMNVALYRKKSLRRWSPADSTIKGDFTCQIGTPQARSESRHRVVEFTDIEGKIMRVVTNLYEVDAEKIASMYQARWAIEVFFRWIKQHLNVPTLFGTTENAVFNQLYAALLAYVVLKTLYEEGKQHRFIQSASFVSFTRQFIETQLSIEWDLVIQVFIKNYQDLYGSSVSKTG
jgi:IS4 transposase